MENTNESDNTNKEKVEVSPSSSLDTVKDLVEVVGKIVIGLFAIFYAIGLMVVNIYLNNFGVYSLSLFRLNYITAGVWSLIPLITFFLLILILVSTPLFFFRKGRKFLNFVFPDRYKIFDNEPTSNILAFIILIVFTAVLFGVLYSSIFKQTEITFAMLKSIGIGILFIIYLLFIPLFSFEKSHLWSRFIRGFIFTFISIILFFYYINTFSNNLFGKIPSYLGGGSPKKAQLILDDESKIKEKLENLGVMFHSTTLTANVQILLATDEEYILLIESTDLEGKPKLNGLTLPKDKIQAVLYEESAGSSGGAY